MQVKVLVCCRRTRCWAQHKQYASSLDHGSVNSHDPHNCGVYVGNISQDTSDQDLRQQFSQFGQITDGKIYRTGAPHVHCYGVTQSISWYVMYVDTAYGYVQTHNGMDRVTVADGSALRCCAGMGFSTSQVMQRLCKQLQQRVAKW